MRNLLDIESLDAAGIRTILGKAAEMKRLRGPHPDAPLAGECWAVMFSKSSTRTRVSFEVGIRELGGQPIFLSSNDIQLGRGEPIRDTARVLGRMVQGAVIRTYAQDDVVEFARLSGLRTINALTDAEHPCQILSDLFTIIEKRGTLDGLTVAFIGDGDCNVARSWIWAAARCGFNLRIAAPQRFQPPHELVTRAGGNITVTTDVLAASAGADVLYTDVWISMGKEDEAAFRTAQFGGYQINRETVEAAGGSPLVMHCLPAYRGKEITDDVFEANAQTIFDQAENRLHTQKAILTLLEK
ncbi:MAG: ornithine carbamoyltransferase [Chthoniobacterales bacterium]|nr:ornithine carbamoyltransferase [Chthoniobacterales bacterium]